MTDIIERLRKMADECEGWSEWTGYDLVCMRDAANEIGRLRAEIERLATWEPYDFYKANAGRPGPYREGDIEIERLRARIKELEDGLENRLNSRLGDRY